MILKSLDWAFLRAQACVHAEGELQDKLHLDLALRQVASTELCSEYGCSAEALAKLQAQGEQLKSEPGLYGSETTSSAINQVWYLDLTISSDEPVVIPQTTLDLRLPVDNTQSLWLPSICTPCKNIRPKGMLEYNTSFTSHICNLAPMGAFFSAEGINKLAFALSDCKNIVNVNIGAYEEEEAARITFTLFSQPLPATNSYRVSLRLDTSTLPVFNALQNITRYYEREVNNDIMPVPEGALEPVYSTWYAFLQNLEEKEIEEQCALAAEAGCKTVIVDDGWQTDDNNRGYAFCGDWQVSTKRFPHMKEHVQRVHALGMKYMVWFAVPFIGSKSQHHEEYKDYCLCFNPRWNAYVLDPRFKKVRDFLVNTFANMVKTYDLDGLKLDFIDEFDMRQADEKAQAYNAERDTQSLPEAVDMLMSEVRAALSAIKSDILIEFRQNYVGPMIRKFGNMFRAHDCPNDTLMNRMTTTDVRAMTGNDRHATAVHADMFIWSPLESVESSSLNFIHTLFAVPQVSPNFKHLNEEHRAMVKHWLTFWHDHRELLMYGQMYALHPEFMYTILGAHLGAQELMVVGSDHILELFSCPETKELTLVNGAMKTDFVIRLPKSNGQESTPVTVNTKTYDCLGRLVSEYSLELSNQIQEITLPKSGYIVMQRS